MEQKICNKLVTLNPNFEFRFFKNLFKMVFVTRLVLIQICIEFKNHKLKICVCSRFDSFNMIRGAVKTFSGLINISKCW